MTSASDQTDDRIILPSGEADEQLADAQVIHGSIVHEDGPGPDDEAGAAGAEGGLDRPDLPRRVRPESSTGPATDEPAAGPATDESVAGPGADEPAMSDRPRRAWIPETPVPSPRQPDSPVAAQPDPPVAAQSVFGQRTTAEAEQDEPELDEPELDEPAQAEPDRPEMATAEPESAILDQPAADQPADQPAVAEPPAGENPWPAIQSMFVDDPRQAVEQAAHVTTTALADLISAAKKLEQTLRGDWTSEHAGTEELRVALRGYRDLSARIGALTRGI